MATVQFALVPDRFTIGDWATLTVEQQRVFITFVVANYSGDIGGGDPNQFSESLWNDSVKAANTGGLVSGRLLDLSQLTTYIGVTSMWEKRGVISQVTLVSNVNGDQPDHEFRLFGELSAGGGEVVKKAFKYSIGGSGHGEYSVSRREQGFFGQPNGQFSLTEDLMRFDSDVDYRMLANVAGHNTRENSDIREYDGDTPHLERHVKRYGEVPIKMGTVDRFGKPASVSNEEYQRALEVGDLFVRKFESKLTLRGIYEEMFSADALETIKGTDFFDAVGLRSSLLTELNDAALKSVYINFIDFIFLKALLDMTAKNISTGRTINDKAISLAKIGEQLRSLRYLKVLADPSATDDGSVHLNDAGEVEEFIVELQGAAAILREQLRTEGLYSELFRENLLRMNRQRQSHFRVERQAVSDGIAGEVTKYVVEQGVYVIFMVDEGGSLKICYLGLGN